MGTDYALGVIDNITATANRELLNKDWVELLNERVDVSLFDLQFTGVKVTGVLRSNIFSENIAGFYSMLKEILGAERNPGLDYYEEYYGTDLENYQRACTTIRIRSDQGDNIRLDLEFAILFIEGKVLVEEFYTEPVLMNWLFRNSKIENKLAGCVVSSIVG